MLFILTANTGRVPSILASSFSSPVVASCIILCTRLPASFSPSPSPSPSHKLTLPPTKLARPVTYDQEEVTGTRLIHSELLYTAMHTVHLFSCPCVCVSFDASMPPSFSLPLSTVAHKNLPVSSSYVPRFIDLIHRASIGCAQKCSPQLFVEYPSHLLSGAFSLNTSYITPASK